MTEIRWFDQLTELDRAIFGGKAWRLAQMTQAGLPVPAGFCIGGSTLESLDRDAILTAYRLLGGAVAVRSSSIAEDGRQLSFAGQFDSVLDVEGVDQLIDAVSRCLCSRQSPRSRAYRVQMAVPTDAPMAVIVQRFVRSDCSGVLFTRDPNDDSAMSLEAVSGASSDVQSGHSMAFRCAIGRQTGTIRTDHPQGSPTQLQIQELYSLGQQIESLLGCSCDIEWIVADDQIHIVQARPITTPSVAEREALRRDEIDAASFIAAGEKTVWVQDQLSEGLPNPTPMTWALLQRLLAANGGFGRMYRELGIIPDPVLGDRSAYDLIAGRPFLNLNRAARMQFGDLPLGYSFEKIKASPSSALARRPVWQTNRTGIRDWLRLPRMLWRLRRRERTLEREYAELPERLQRILPAHTQAFEVEADAYSTERTREELLKWLDGWCEHVFVAFGMYSFRAAALAEHALAQLRAALPADSAEKQIAELLSTVQIEPAANVSAALADQSAGRMSEVEFRTAFGHRADCELELAMPRYSEWEGPIFPPGGLATTTAGIREHDFAQFPPRASVWARRLVEFTALRETAKHHFLRGYAVIRKILLELDRRLSLGGGIFFLTPEELDGGDKSNLIAERRRCWVALKSLSVPTVLFSDDLDQLGRSQSSAESSDCINGVPLSTGDAEAPALVLLEPDDRRPVQPYVLVCSNCDPAWTTLMLGARAAVFESGGLLSHGAIVAREFGIPAVGAATQATRRIRTGQIVRVNGTAGTVTWRPCPDEGPAARGE